MLLDNCQWLLVVYDDCFVPELLPDLLTALAELDDETGALTITCAAFNAEPQLMRN